MLHCSTAICNNVCKRYTVLYGSVRQVNNHKFCFLQNVMFWDGPLMEIELVKLEQRWQSCSSIAVIGAIPTKTTIIHDSSQGALKLVSTECSWLVDTLDIMVTNRHRNHHNNHLRHHIHHHHHISLFYQAKHKNTPWQMSYKCVEHRRIRRNTTNSGRRIPSSVQYHK